MELERTQIQKTLFGNYKPAEVDRLLDTAEALLEQRKAETAEASTEASKSIVATTGERSAGRATKGEAKERASAQA